jgi:hypothetical protein
MLVAGEGRPGISKSPCRYSWRRISVARANIAAVLQAAADDDVLPKLSN